MTETYYTKEHEWLRVDGDEAIVGITQFAQEQLGDIVFIDLPSIDKEFAQGDEMCIVESVKVASEVYAPVSGSVISVNEALNDQPEIVNDSAETEGWFVKMKLNNKDELSNLLSKQDYDNFLEGLG